MKSQLSKFGRLIAMAVVAFSGSSEAATLSLTWQAPGDPDVASYRIYWGAVSRFIPGSSYASTVPIGNVTNYSITVPDNQTLFFTVTALDMAGNESGYSNEVTATTTVGGGSGGGSGDGGTGGDGSGGGDGDGTGGGAGTGKRLPTPTGPVRAILDFDGDAVSDIGLFADAGLGIQNEVSLSGAGGTFNFDTDHAGLVGAFADYDGDGITDIGMVERTSLGLVWSALESGSGLETESNFGASKDYYLTGCHFDSDLLADRAAVKARKIVINKSDGSADTKLGFKVARRGSSAYCADMNGDGIDEVIISGKLTRKQLSLLEAQRRGREYYVAVYMLDGRKVFERFFKSMRNIVTADFNSDGFEELGLYAPDRGSIKYYLVGAKGGGKFQTQNITRATPITIDNGSGLRANGLLVQGADGRTFQYDFAASTEVELAVDAQSRALITEIGFGR